MDMLVFIVRQLIFIIVVVGIHRLVASNLYTLIIWHILFPHPFYGSSPHTMVCSPGNTSFLTSIRQQVSQIVNPHRCDHVPNIADGFFPGHFLSKNRSFSNLKWWIWS